MKLTMKYRWHGLKILAETDTYTITAPGDTETSEDIYIGTRRHITLLTIFAYDGANITKYFSERSLISLKRYIEEKL